MHGSGIKTLADGSTHIGEFQDNHTKGQGKRTCAKSGHSLLTHWIEQNKFEGESIYNFGNRTWYMGQIRDNLPYGHVTLIHGDGSRYTGQWVKGKSGPHEIFLGAVLWKYQQQNPIGAARAAQADDAETGQEETEQKTAKRIKTEP